MIKTTIINDPIYNATITIQPKQKMAYAMKQSETIYHKSYQNERKELTSDMKENNSELIYFDSVYEHSDT